MKRRTVLVSLTAFILTTGAATCRMAYDYTHPQVAGRSTPELQREVISSCVRHADDRWPLRTLSAMRERRLSEELVHRFPDELRQLELAEARQEAAVTAGSTVGETALGD